MISSSLIWNKLFDSHMPRRHFDQEIDVTDNLVPEEKDIIKAKEDIQKYKLNYDFKSVDDLYLEDYGPSPFNFE